MGRTAVAVSGLAESGLVRRLTRGRLWIGALATLLVGIVALNVLALSLNASSTRVGRQTDALKREISILRAQIASAGASNERVQSEAAKLGLIVPEPGSIRYLSPDSDDAAAAAKRVASGELTAGDPYTAAAPVADAAAPTPAAPIAAPAAATEPSQEAPPTSAPPTTDATAGAEATSATAAPSSPAGGQTDGARTGGGATASGGGLAAP